MMSLNDWIEKLEALDPTRIELGLERSREVWSRLSTGPITAKVLTVTGTNGKGTCTVASDTILRQAGLKVGLYTSPHIRDFNERIQINGLMETGDELARAFDRVEAARGDIDLTYFEFTTLACFDLFQRNELDVWVLEVGLGGRLDTVNIIDPDVAVITSVAMDHMDWLGNSLKAVAIEKSGIFREGIPVVLGQSDMPPIARRKADELNCQIYQNEREWEAYLETSIGQPQGWSWQGRSGSNRLALLTGLPYRSLHLDSLGCAIQAAWLIHPELSEAVIHEGLQRTQLRGRWQCHMTSKGVEVVLDVAHNPAAGNSLRNLMRQNAVSGRTSCVIGMMADKEHQAFIGEIAPEIDDWFITHPGSDRGWDGAKIRDELLPGALYLPNPEIALANAVNRASPGDRVLVCGSFLTVAAVMDSEELL